MKYYIYMQQVFHNLKDYFLSLITHFRNQLVANLDLWISDDHLFVSN